MRTPRGLLLLFCVLALVAAACNGGGEAVDLGEAAEETEAAGSTPEETAGEEAPEAEADGEQAAGGTLVAAIAGEPDQLDPHSTSAYPSFQVLENVYDTLVQPNADLEFEPALATDWQISDDQLTWTFTLREGVTFHDGSELTSEDVKFSYDRIVNENLANAFRFDAVEEVRAPDPQTVEIQLTRPAPNLLANIGAFKGMAIVPSEFDETTASSPVGTGPFVFESFEQGQAITLSANPDYWGEGPFVDGVEFRFIPEPTVALTNLQGGQVDWTDNIPPQQVATLEGAENIVLGQVPSTDYFYFAPNQAREPFDDPRVRQALAYAFDREAVAEAAQFGAATPNQTAIPEGSTFASDYAPYSYDPERARQLLDEAGIEDLTVDLILADNYPETTQAAQVMASQMAEAGIALELRTLDFATWLDEQAQGNFDAFMLTWVGNIDPDDYYYAQHHSGGSFNFQGYANPEVDELLDAARVETDQGARRELYHQAVELIVDDASYVYLYNPDVVQAWTDAVQGYEARPDSAIRFEDVSLQR